VDRAVESLIGLLERRASEAPERTYLEHEGVSHGYARVLAGARRYQAALERAGVRRGGRVLLILDNGPEFFHAFFGVQAHGAIPVPLSPKSPAERLSAIAADCAAAFAFVSGDSPVTDALRGRTATPAEVEALAASSTAPARPVPGAFVQYTSGSTGQAKGAVISQRAVLANIAAFTEAMDVRPDDVFSSMMPLFHDMGLVCFGLAPLWCGVPLVLYRQEAISLYRWLEGFGARRVTVSGGPNVFLRLANKLVADPRRYDLSSLRILLCGSEPIFPEVVREFERRFGVEGRVKPAYGMAEVTLCATMTGAADAYRIHEHRTISCGTPLRGVEVSILGGDGVVATAPFVTGEVLVESPALMTGYLGKPGLTREARHGRAYRSGDTGFLDDEGRLYVVGRHKNLIVRGGRKLAPSDLEAVASEFGEVVSSAAVPARGDAGATHPEQVVLIAEVGRDALRDRPRLRALAARISAEAGARVHFRPDEVLFVRRGRIPVTLNGKVQHLELRAQLAAGAIAGERFAAADLV
jgi:acyl-CoA synthetase (AMP-forming)/AMP-acid ligase II